MALVPCDTPRANQPKFTPPVGERHQEELPLNGVANDDVTPLCCGVVRIIVDPCERVLKHSCSFFERDAVLEEVGRRLRSVPLERGSSHRGDATAKRRVSGSVRLT
jgi:hypothetical protein